MAASNEAQAKALATMAQGITITAQTLAQFADVTEDAIGQRDSVWGDTWAERIRENVDSLFVIRDEMRKARLELDIEASR